MYQRVLLATDETRQSAIALREGALLARQCRASVFLLVVTERGAGHLVADGVHPLPPQTQGVALLQQGLDRLKKLGLEAAGSVAIGEPALVIADAARRFRADLVVVGHRRQHLLDRWWSGASGAYIVDNVACSVLIARKEISDAEFERAMAPP
ncbi:MAG TPA: universal stress protein [Caulobacteraceae bacterium]|nr:universal stress protein [Caulobacteraceae bacterium]